MVIKKIVLACFNTLVVVIVTLSLILLLEGIASFYLAATIVGDSRDATATDTSHKQYDSDLGWTNQPDFYDSDFYGQGIYFKSNAQGFRNDSDIGIDVSAGKRRAICSGDSFTMGMGVANRDTWCYLLSQEMANLETVNMGMDGYGVDQAYLWYLRDGIKLAHDIHIFAFITDDFFRMLVPEFDGYAKPVLVLSKNGELVTENTPVPASSRFLSWGGRQLEKLGEISLFKLFRRHFSPVVEESSGLAQSSKQIEPLLARIFENLKEANQQKDSQLLIMYIPVESDYGNNGSDPYRLHISDMLAKKGIAFLDLVPELRKLPQADVASMYLRNIGSGHMNRSGNEWVAAAIVHRLNTLNVGARAEASVEPDPRTAPWRVAYYSNTKLQGASLVRSAKTVDYSWGDGSPDPELPVDGFSGRWRTCLKLRQETKVKFYLSSDDGSRLLIDGSLEIDIWGDHADLLRAKEISLDAGMHAIQVEYYESGGGAKLALRARIGNEVPKLLAAPDVTLPLGSQGSSCSSSLPMALN